MRNNFNGVEKAVDDFNQCLKTSMYPSLFLDMSTSEIWCHIDISENDLAYWYNVDHINLSAEMVKEGESLSGLTVKRVLDFVAMHWAQMYEGRREEAVECAARIRANDEWDMADAQRLCELAGLLKEWATPNQEDFESVIFEAADRFGLEVL